MSSEVRYNSRSIRLLYYRYKDSTYFSLSILCGIIGISILLIFQVVLPQLQNWFSIRAETSATEERINIIKDNTRLATTINAITLQEHVQLVSLALPPEKEFVGILNAITDSALAAQVTLEDYDFSVGELSKTAPAENTYPTQVELTLANDFVGAARFIERIEQKIPLAHVESVSIGNDTAIIKVNFAYKPYPEIVYNDSKPMNVITDAQLQLITTLSQWKPGEQILQPVPTASDATQSE